MRNLLIILTLGCFTLTQAQVTNTTNQTQNPNVTHVTRNYDARETVNRNGEGNNNYATNNNGYTITNGEDGTTSTIGKLRKKVSDEEYYIFHSNNDSRQWIDRSNNDNFNSFRNNSTIDPVNDQYMKNMTERARRTQTNRNIQENMNTSKRVVTPSDSEPNIKTPINH